MQETTEEKMIYRLLRDPDDMSAREAVKRFVGNGRIVPEKVTVGSGGQRRGGALALEDFEDQLRNAHDSIDHWYRAYKREERKAAKHAGDEAAIYKQLEGMKAKLRKLQAENAEKATRVHHRADDRLLDYRSSVRAALMRRSCDRDENGFMISWRVRERALEFFRLNLWKLRRVDDNTLREITQTLARGDDTAGMIDVSVMRAGPPPVDWILVRDRLQISTEGI